MSGEFQSQVAATLPPGTTLHTDTVNGKLVEYVKIDLGEAGVSLPMTASNITGSWLGQTGRSILITYTDATKATIDHIDFKDSGTTIYTLTPTFGATTDLWTRS